MSKLTKGLTAAAVGGVSGAAKGQLEQLREEAKEAKQMRMMQLENTYASNLQTQRDTSASMRQQAGFQNVADSKVVGVDAEGFDVTNKQRAGMSEADRASVMSPSAYKTKMQDEQYDKNLTREESSYNKGLTRKYAERLEETEFKAREWDKQDAAGVFDNLSESQKAMARVEYSTGIKVPKGTKTTPPTAEMFKTAKEIVMANPIEGESAEQQMARVKNGAWVLSVKSKFGSSTDKNEVKSLVGGGGEGGTKPVDTNNLIAIAQKGGNAWDEKAAELKAKMPLEDYNKLMKMVGDKVKAQPGKQSLLDLAGQNELDSGNTRGSMQEFKKEVDTSKMTPRAIRIHYNNWLKKKQGNKVNKSTPASRDYSNLGIDMDLANEMQGAHDSYLDSL